MHLCVETKNQDGLWGFVQSVNLIGLPLCRPCSKGRKVNCILTVKVVVPSENIQRGGVDEETGGRIGSVLGGDLR